jgi:hypothetical protein
MKYEKYHCNSASKNEIWKIALTPTAFRLVLSAGKLNVPLGPSQDYFYKITRGATTKF